MNVAILGINGFLGTAIGQHATGLGHSVVGISRSSIYRSIPGIPYVSGDRGDSEFIKRVLLERQIDVLVDVIPMVVTDTQPLLDCIDESIAQYIMLSSSDVYSNYELLHRCSSGDPWHGSVDEDSPLRSTAFPYRELVPRAQDAADKYLDDYDKIPIERSVQRLSSAWTILRLPMVFGPGDKQRRFRWAISPMLRGEEKLVIPRSWGHWQSTYGYIDNVGAAVALTLGDPRAENRIFNVTEKSPVSQLEWARRFASALDWRGTIALTDDPYDLFARRLQGLDLSVPFRISGNRFRETFGFSDVAGEPIALARTIESEREA